MSAQISLGLEGFILSDDPEHDAEVIVAATTKNHGDLERYMEGLPDLCKDVDGRHALVKLRFIELLHDMIGQDDRFVYQSVFVKFCSN